MRRERSVELPQRQTIRVVRLDRKRRQGEDEPWVSSRNIRRSASSFSESERLSEFLKGSAKRVESSKTASEEREKVSHYVAEVFVREDVD